MDRAIQGRCKPVCHIALPLSLMVFPPGLLIFSRPIITPLGYSRERVMSYKDFESNCLIRHEEAADKWNKKFRAKNLPELNEDQLVWVNAPTDKGQEGIVVSKDDNHPDSYLVKVGDKVIRRSRKHLLVLQNSTPDNDYDDTIMPLALNWYCPNAGDNQCGNPGINGVHPGVNFNLEPTVYVVHDTDLNAPVELAVDS